MSPSVKPDAALQPVTSIIREAIQAVAPLLPDEKRVSKLIEHLPATIALFDRDMRYVAASSGWLDNYGLKKNELSDRRHYELFPSLAERWKELQASCLRGKSIRDEVDKFVRADGRKQKLQLEMWPWRTGRKIRGMFVAADAALPPSPPPQTGDDALQAIADIGMWRLHKGCNKITMSAGMCRMLGVRGQKVLGYKQFLAAVNPDDRKRVDACWKSALQGEPYDVEYRIAGAGKEIWVRARAQLTFDAKGKPVGGLGTFQDISDHKRKEEALTHLAAIVASSPYAIASTSLEGIVTSWNAAAERLYGYSPEEIIGQPMNRLFRPGTADREGGLEGAMGAGLAVRRYSGSRLHKNGKTIEVQVMARAVRSTAGEVIGFCEFALDKAAPIDGPFELQHRLGRLLEKIERAEDDITGLNKVNWPSSFARTDRSAGTLDAAWVRQTAGLVASKATTVARDAMYLYTRLKEKYRPVRGKRLN